MAKKTGIRFIPQKGAYSYTYTPHLKPIARVKPGEVIELHTPDAFENRLKTSKDFCTKLCHFPFMNPQVGPIFVTGAEPGDTLAVKIHDILPDRDFAVTGLIPHFGGLTGTSATAILNEPIPEETRILPLKNGEIIFNDRIRLPYRPFVGTIGVAPALESISSLVPNYYGGNMDCVDTSPGNEIWFPVQVQGAHFFTGDAHATQGDGELTGVAAELAAKVILSFRVIKKKKINWPRIVSDTHLMTCGSARPLEDAARIAWKELVLWLSEDYQLSKFDAYHLLGQIGQMRVGNMVDPNYTMVAKIERKYVENLKK